MRRIALAVSTLVSLPALAIVQPRHDEGLHRRVVAPAGFVATVAPQPLAEVEHEVRADVLAQVSAFRGAHRGAWSFFVDRRSGAMALVEGEGIPWLPGAGNDLAGPVGREQLVERALELIDRHPALFGVARADLVLDERATRTVGEHGQIWSIVFTQVGPKLADGGLRIPVEGSRVVFRVAHGNLVQFGVDRVIPAAMLPNPGPILTAAEARGRLAAHVGGFTPHDRFVIDGVLSWVPRGTGDQVGWGGAIGEGWTAALSYRFEMQRPGVVGSWNALVDATSGGVLRFVDANDYASVLMKGSVYTKTNCTDPLDCVPGSATEVAVTLPFAALNFAGGVCTGDACYTNSAGAFSYPPGAVSASTSLDGKYFRIVDACGGIAASGVAPNGIDLGTSLPNPPLNTNTDCFPANRESPPSSGPTSGGSGDTHAARNLYYHLNLIGQKARIYLPDNDWLQGADGPRGAVTTTSNGAPACNAFWQGGTGTLNFERVTPGLSCNNTGEIPDVFLHEFGHGLDQNDGTGTAPESATGEALGDTFAILQSQASCVGSGFRLQDPLLGPWANRAGYGSGSWSCSGVRDADYTRHCAHGSGVGCTPPVDPDAPNGSRSGTNPPPDPADAGTPARWNHMIEDAPGGVADGQSNFYDCGGPEIDGCAGPLNHGCHCESVIASQANWELAKKLIATEFGGNVYASPQGPKEVSGWQFMDRLWYLSLDLAVSAYSVTGPAPTGTTNGCSIDNWYSTYRLVDDDDGSLANGTPHADIIFAAMDLHGIACGTAVDPTNQATGCPTPLAAPTLSTCDAKAPVQLDWTDVAGASEFRILRNTLGCGFGFTPIATVGGQQSYFEDADVAPGVTYYYSVQPVGSSDSCYGQASNCIAVNPSACPASPLPAPTGVALTTPAPNQIRVTWNAVPNAQSYKVYRKAGTCSGTGTYVAVGTVLAPATTFLDTTGVQGGITYSYQVVAAATTCAACTSPRSSCRQATATGTCTIPPEFDGVTTVVAAAEGSCRLTIGWADGTPACGSSLAFDVHRSTTHDFVPGPATLLVSGVTGLAYEDWGVQGGTRYWYIVRAVDTYGNQDDNTVRRGETPVGSRTPGTYTDNAGDSGAAKLTPSPTINNTWAVRPSGPGNATKHYATTPSGTYATNSCMGLESDTIALGSSSTLSFRSSYDMEQGWDGGYVEVATEAGGFSNWTKLTTVNYPGVMSGPLGGPACGGPGFADGAPVFTGTSLGWATYSGSLSAYANQNVRVRFLFSSDPATVAGGWLIDDIQVSNAFLPGPCLGEVSRRDSGHPLRVRKRGDGDLDLIFEDLGASATAYNVYEGALGTWYSHTRTTCHNTGTAGGSPAPGDRTWTAYDVGPGNVYFLVNAVNATTEGVLGLDGDGELIQLPASPCGPMP